MIDITTLGSTICVEPILRRRSILKFMPLSAHLTSSVTWPF